MGRLGSTNIHTTLHIAAGSSVSVYEKAAPRELLHTVWSLLTCLLAAPCRCVPRHIRHRRSSRRFQVLLLFLRRDVAKQRVTPVLLFNEKFFHVFNFKHTLSSRWFIFTISSDFPKLFFRISSSCKNLNKNSKVSNFSKEGVLQFHSY